MILVYGLHEGIGFLGGLRINSESANEEVFKEYVELEPKRKTLEHYIVMFIHIVVALTISAFQLNYGISEWVLGFGIVTPILLILHGFAYSFFDNGPWYRNQMVPYISRLVTTTEIETDRYLTYRRNAARYLLFFGWIAILPCQFVWTFGFTEVLPFFAGDDLILRFIGELVGYVVLFGPFLLYFLILVLFAGILDRIRIPRYKDIEHLFDIEDKWTKENNRRAKNPESMQDEEEPHGRQGI